MPELTWDVFRFDFCHHLCEFSDILHSLLKSGVSKPWPLYQSFLSPVFIQALNKNSFHIIKRVKKIKGSTFSQHMWSIKVTLPCLCLKLLKRSLVLLYKPLTFLQPLAGRSWAEPQSPQSVLSRFENSYFKFWSGHQDSCFPEVGDYSSFQTQSLQKGYCSREFCCCFNQLRSQVVISLLNVAL